MKLTVEINRHRKQLYWLLPDDMLPAEYVKERPDEGQGWPQTVKLVTTGSNTIPMTERIQRWLYALNPGLAPNAFEVIFDTWNVVGKVRDCANYITGDRLDMPLPKYPIDLTFGCNVISGTEMVWPGGYGIPVGKKMLKIGTIDPSNLPATNDPSLIHHMTIIRSNVVDGRQTVNPFPHNGGRYGKPCFTGLLSNQPLYIQLDRVMKLSTSEVPNPYWPEWRWQ